MPSLSTHVFYLRTKTLYYLLKMDNNPPLTPPKYMVRGKEESSKGDTQIDEVHKSAGNPASQKGRKRPSSLRDSTNAGFND